MNSEIITDFSIYFILHNILYLSYFLFILIICIFFYFRKTFLFFLKFIKKILFSIYIITQNNIDTMKVITWEELIESKEEKITLIWYWSLLNTDTHHSEHKIRPVIFYGFTRKYNLPCVPNKITPKWEKFARNYLTRYGINCDKTFQEYLNNNYCVLNCEYTGDQSDSVNGLAVEIHKDEFDDYSLREEKYVLYQTPYFDFTPDTWEIWNIKSYAYILVGKKWETCDTSKRFEAYHKSTRKWAYNIWEKFWEYFDKTTLK